MIAPTWLDIWLARELSGNLKRTEEFTLLVQSAMSHTLLGGLWYGAAIFYFWTGARKKGQVETQVRILSILVGSMLAILLTLIAGAIISWPPPAHYPGLQELYPAYLEPNPNSNCFPSQSTALYSSIAAGIYSIHKGAGKFLWVLVPLFVGLPRMYVEGHYFTDVVVGLLIGVISYYLIQHFTESRLTARILSMTQSRPGLNTLMELLIFLWIIQVTVEFKDGVWVEKLAERIIR